MMRLIKSVMLVIATLLSASVLSQSLADRESHKPVKKMGKYISQETDFGSYKVERNLAYIPKSIAKYEKIVSIEGLMAIVRTNNYTQQIVTKNSLVRNSFNNTISPLSGNIIILLKDDISIDQIVKETGLTLVSNYAGTNLAVVSVNGGQDLVEASKQLKTSGLVKSARIEVLDNLNKPH